MIDKYVPYVHYAAKYWHHRSNGYIAYDDLVCSGMMGLALAIKRADRPLTLTYVTKNVDGAISDFINDACKRRNINLELPDNYDIPYYEEPTNELLPLMVNAMQYVEPLPRSIIHMSYHMRMNAVDIGKTFGISLSYVSKLKRRGLKQLKQIITHNKLRRDYERI